MASVGAQIIEISYEGIQPQMKAKNQSLKDDGFTSEKVSRKNSDNIKIISDQASQRIQNEQADKQQVSNDQIENKKNVNQNKNGSIKRLKNSSSGKNLLIKQETNELNEPLTSPLIIKSINEHQDNVTNAQQKTAVSNQSPYLTVTLRNSNQTLQNDIRKLGTGKANSIIRNTTNGDNQQIANGLGTIVGNGIDLKQQNRTAQLLASESTSSQNKLQQPPALQIKNTIVTQESAITNFIQNNQQLLQQSNNNFKNSNFSHSLDSTPINFQNQPGKIIQQQKQAQSQPQNQMTQAQNQSRFPPIQKLTTITHLQQYQGQQMSQVQREQTQGSFSFGNEGQNIENQQPLSQYKISTPVSMIKQTENNYKSGQSDALTLGRQRSQGGNIQQYGSQEIQIREGQNETKQVLANHLQMGGQMMIKNNGVNGGQYQNKLNNFPINQNIPTSNGVFKYQQLNNNTLNQAQQLSFVSGNPNGERIFANNNLANSLIQNNQLLSSGLAAAGSALVGQRNELAGLQFGVQGQTYLNRRGVQNTPQQLNQIHFQAQNHHQSSANPSSNINGFQNSSGSAWQANHLKEVGQINFPLTEPKSPQSIAEIASFKVSGYALNQNQFIGINNSQAKTEKTTVQIFNDSQHFQNNLPLRTIGQYSQTNSGYQNQQNRGTSLFQKDLIISQNILMQNQNTVNNNYNLSNQNTNQTQPLSSDFMALSNISGNVLDLKGSQNGMIGAKAPNFNMDRYGLGVNSSHQTSIQNQNNNNNALLPTSSQVSSTLFIMDCQTFGIFQNQKLLKLENAREMINSEQNQEQKHLQSRVANKIDQINSFSINNQNTAKKNDILIGENEFTEAQLVNFVIARAQQSTVQAQQRQKTNDPKQIQQNQLSQSIIPKELPKLSDDAKGILNTVKAQKHLQMFHSKVQKIDTLVIELDYYEYKNQLLQQLFHHYGNRVLSNLIHKIMYSPELCTKSDENQILELSQKEMNTADFQTLEDYIAKIREGQQKKQKKNKTQTNQLKQKKEQPTFSYMNDFSSIGDFEILQNDDFIEQKELDLNKQQNLITANSEKENQRRKSETNILYGNNLELNHEQMLKKQTQQESETDQNEEKLSNQAQNEQLTQNKRKELDKVLSSYLEELQHLFPKYNCKRVDGELTFIDLDDSFNDQKHPQTDQQSQQKTDKSKVKKLNFHVIVKNSRLYSALKFIEEFKRLQGMRASHQFQDQNINELGKIATEIELNNKNDKVEEVDVSTVFTKGGQNVGEFGGKVLGFDENGQRKEFPLSAYNLSSELSQNSSLLPQHLRNLSSFVLIKDCSILKFALYCFHVGIVASVQQMMRQFFKHVFIVIKPGTRTLPNGQIQLLKELPLVDIEKINKYLMQTKMRKLLQNQKLLGKGGEKGILLKRCNNCIVQNQPYCTHIAAEILAQFNHQNLYGPGSQNVPGQYSYSALNQGQVPPANQQSWNNKFRAGVNQQNKNKTVESGETEFYQRSFSLTSFKSMQDPNRSDQAMIAEYFHHFNSGPSTIKVEGPATQEKTTITIFHKSYTHLDNSRIQKAFKIYNEFNQLVFKSRLHIIQNPDNFHHQASELGNKGELTRIYKLAGHMGIKLPRRVAGSALGRQPIVEMLKNQRSVGQIKEQMVKFIHRILNEENEISMKFFNTILLNTLSTNSNAGNLQAALIAQGLTASSGNLVSGTQGVKPESSPIKNQNPETHPFIDLQKLAQIIPNNGQSKKQKAQIDHIQQDKIQNKQQKVVISGQSIKPLILPAQPTTIFRHQVGLGNNHPLIKSLMKQRLWWHHIQPRNAQGQVLSNIVGQNGQQFFVIKIDFEEAQIMWTQWRKIKLYDYMIPLNKFQSDYKDLLIAIENKQIQIQNTNNYNKDEATKGEKSRNEKVQTGAAVQVAIAKQENQIENEKQQTKETDQSVGTRLKLNRVKSTHRNQNTAKGANDYSSAHERRLSSDFKQFQVKSKGSRRKQRTAQNNFQDDEDQGSSDRSVKEIKDQKSKSQLKVITLKTETKLISLIELKNMIEKCKKQFQKVYNRLEFNQHLNNKKALFFNMRNYYNYCCADQAPEGTNPQNLVFNALPLTFHIKTGVTDPNFSNFEQYYQKYQGQPNASQKNIWILKPGENTNRGTGIKVESDLSKIKQLVQQYCFDEAHTCILQKYIDNPLLYNRRKFDIRCFALITCHNGLMKAYFYRDGYIRTSSKEYSMNNLTNKYVHLVNDAIQKYGDDYGKYEAGNKLSYQELQKYFTLTYPDKKINLERDIIMQVKKIVTDTVRATFHLLDAKKRLNSFELFGYDFMFDEEFRPMLIEVNSNPSLEPSNNNLVKLFTCMLDNTFRIAIEPLFPPSEGYSLKKGSIGIETCPENRFDLIFDERIDGAELLKKFERIGKKELQELQSINELEGSEDEKEIDEVEAVANDDQIQDITG